MGDRRPKADFFHLLCFPSKPEQEKIGWRSASKKFPPVFLGGKPRVANNNTFASPPLLLGGMWKKGKAKVTQAQPTPTNWGEPLRPPFSPPLWHQNSPKAEKQTFAFLYESVCPHSYLFFGNKFSFAEVGDFPATVVSNYPAGQPNPTRRAFSRKKGKKFTHSAAAARLDGKKSRPHFPVPYMTKRCEKGEEKATQSKL